MMRRKKAPAGRTAAGRTTNDDTYYHKDDVLSTAQRIAKHRTGIPVKYRQLYDRCIAGTESPRNAIRMQCLECWGWVQTETAKCDNYLCPLFFYRPYQRSPKSLSERVQAPQSDYQRREGVNDGEC